MSGLVAILAGTLSDERTAKIAELHDAYVGVVGSAVAVLDSADPRANDQATTVSLLNEMQEGCRWDCRTRRPTTSESPLCSRMSTGIEVTAKVIRKAVGDLKHARRANAAEHTFHGSDLVCSLGAVLTGAWPLARSMTATVSTRPRTGKACLGPAPAAVGASIIHTVKRYVTLLGREPHVTSPRDAYRRPQGGFRG